MKRIVSFTAWVLLTGILLQVFFVVCIALMLRVDPQSTAFQRTQILRVAQTGQWAWAQQWVPYPAISDHLKRAVIAAEDSDYIHHDGVQWEALEQARARNAAASARAEAQRQQALQRLAQAQARAQKKVDRLEKTGRPVDDKLRALAEGNTPPPAVPGAKIVGGSTISQQLAKNLLLSGERTLLRKGQELLLTYALERILGKQRMLEIYLNNVEWGEGIFGAEAAARYYFRKPARDLSALEAAKLAVMLPRPRYYETHFQSAYLNQRALTIASRARSVALPD